MANKTTVARQAKIAACRITRAGSGFEVLSPSGSTYQVTTTTHLDALGCLFFNRHCTCPAVGDCVHLDAVSNYEMQEAIDSGDYDGADILERVS